MRWPRAAEQLLLTCFTLSKWKALDEALSMICIILQIIEKPNVVIVLLFIQNNWYYKSCLPRSMSSSHLYLYVPQQFQEYKGLFNVGYSTTSSSHPLSNIFNVFPMFWGRIRLCPLRKASENFSPIYKNNWANAFFPIFLAIACTIDVILPDNRKHLEKFGKRYLAMKN